MTDSLKSTIGRLEDLIYQVEMRWMVSRANEIALIISQKEADEIINMISKGMSAWEVRQLRNNYTNLRYKDYRLLVV